jgi:hypothetical protein
MTDEKYHFSVCREVDLISIHGDIQYLKLFSVYKVPDQFPQLYSPLTCDFDAEHLPASQYNLVVSVNPMLPLDIRCSKCF